MSSKAVSDQFGCDRGTPIDRYYIEKFLHENSSDITGDVLEIAENTYSLKFGKNIQPKVLHVDAESGADVTGDLSDTNTLPENFADCFICTQTFNFIYDFNKAIAGSRHILKPGAVLLATVACMAPVSKYDADRWGDFWRFTPQSCEKIFGEVFGSSNVKVTALGNSAAAAMFMKGYAQEDLPANFDYNTNDSICPLVIGIRAVK